MATASAWLVRWAHLLPPGGRVLDLACGSGRHLHWLVAGGWHATGVDRDATALAQAPAEAEAVRADIEQGPWPLDDRQFDAVLVFNYLWRPLWPRIVAALGPKGVLVYETFAAGNETVGRPTRPDFLLQPGELIARCQSEGLRIVGYEDGFAGGPDRFVQRIVAVREARADGAPPRHALPQA